MPSGKSKKAKTKTLNLQEFLGASEGPTSNDSTQAVVQVQSKSSWADEYDSDEEGQYNTKTAPTEIVLPTAPRAILGPDTAVLDRVPTLPPYTAHIANLSYDVEDIDVTQFFSKLNVKEVRLVRDGDSNTGRLKGYGYVDFEDRESLIDALTMHDQHLRGRSIRIDLASSGGNRDNNRDRGTYHRRDERDDDRTSGDWRSGRTEDVRNDRDSHGDRRERRGFDNYEKSRDSYDRRDRDYRGFGGGRRDDRERGSYSRREDEAPKERKKLQLTKRTVETTPGEPVSNQSGIFGEAKPVDTSSKEKELLERRKVNLDASTPQKSGPSPFGNAKPVDTSSREQEIEEKLNISNDNELDKKSNAKYSNSNEEDEGNNNQEEKFEEESNIERKEQVKAPPKKNNTDIFGSAKPVDTSAREREMEKKLNKENVNVESNTSGNMRGSNTPRRIGDEERDWRKDDLRDRRDDKRSFGDRRDARSKRDERDYRGYRRDEGDRRETDRRDNRDSDRRDNRDSDRRDNRDSDRRDDRDSFRRDIRDSDRRDNRDYKRDDRSYRRDDRYDNRDRRDRRDEGRDDGRKSESKPAEFVPKKYVEPKRPNFIDKSKFSVLDIEDAGNSSENTDD